MMRHPRLALRSIILLASGLAVAACGKLPGVGNDPGTGGCESTLQCRDNQVCDPVRLQCVNNLKCGTHSDCGAAAYCKPEDQMCGRSRTGSPCDVDANCLPNVDRCIHGVCGCGGQYFNAHRLPANVLIVLDQSGSMREPTGFANDPRSKWEIAVDAIEGNQKLLDKYGSGVTFGLMLYPEGSGSSCSVPQTVNVDIGPNAVGLIKARLDPTATPSGNTPMGAALARLLNYPNPTQTGVYHRLADPTRANYVLLLTDGMETCGGDAAARALELARQTPPVRTFAVGFGAGTDANELDTIAANGGTGRHYSAQNQAELETAFDAIGGSVLTCNFRLMSVPPDPNQLYVYFGNNHVSRDTADGWTYDATTNQVRFTGSSCKLLSDGTVTDVTIVQGCPPIVK